MRMIRKAKWDDIDGVSQIFLHIIEEEENGNGSTGWKRNIYPTKETAAAALEKNDLFVMEEAGMIIAAMRLNQEQVPEYSMCQWEYPAEDNQVMVMHTLVVDPRAKRHGCGRMMVEFYENYAKEKHCPYLRIDTNEINMRARNMYKKFGFKEVGIVPCSFNGIEHVNLVCIEKKLEL
ncbi:MAG: hypothetical protein PWP24_1890 [Clostridiales bacterium]|nr:hypothetical protein [Clostridiales bacterium]